MIVPMKRVAVLCTASSEKETLDALQSLGVLHVASEPHGDVPELKDAQGALDAASKALSILKEAKCAADGAAATPEDVIAAKGRIDDIVARIAATRHAADLYGNFGDFSPSDLRAIVDGGIKVSLFSAQKDAVPQAGDGRIVKILSEDRKEKLFYGVVIGDFEPGQGVEIIPPPEKSVSELRGEISALEAELESERKSLANTGTSAIAAEVARRSIVRDYASASAAMDSADGIKWIEGYIPEPKVAALSEAAKSHGWGLAVSDPGPEENPPTLLEPPRAFRPILSLFSMLGVVPGYREADVSVVFYSFFTIFFAMLIGDAGYGLVILAATIIARRKFRNAPTAPFTLMGIMSVATIVWGVMTATYFGIPGDNIPAFLKFRTTSWLAEQSNIMQLCFLIGAVQLSIARLWNACVYFPSRKFLAEIGWVGVIWTMFFISSLLIVPGFVFPAAMYYIAVVSVLMIALFMLDKSELKTNGVQLCMLPLNVVSSLGDIISYVRLYAVGLASVKVAENFNTMAMDLHLPLAAKIPCVVLILLLGHGINLVMGALSILVHAVRLNTLEFSNHKGISWAGFAYKPFSK